MSPPFDDRAASRPACTVVMGASFTSSLPMMPPMTTSTLGSGSGAEGAPLLSATSPLPNHVGGMTLSRSLPLLPAFGGGMAANRHVPPLQPPTGVRGRPQAHLSHGPYDGGRLGGSHAPRMVPNGAWRTLPSSQRYQSLSLPSSPDLLLKSPMLTPGGLWPTAPLSAAGAPLGKIEFDSLGRCGGLGSTATSAMTSASRSALWGASGAL